MDSVISRTQTAMADFPLTPAEEPKARYVALDSWRGIAATMLAIFHLQVASHIYFVPLMRNSYLFVDYFFVLSGFVISHAYTGRINNRTELKYFMIRRFGRLYPLHLVTLSVFVVAELTLALVAPHLHHALPRPPLSKDRTLATIPANLLLLNGIGVTPGATWNGPSWSISAEFFVYIIFGIIALLPFSFRRPIAVMLILSTLGLLITFSPGFEICNRFALARCIYSFFIGHLIWQMRHARLRIDANVAEVLALSLTLAFVWVASHGAIQLLSPIPFGFTIFVFSKEQGFISRFMKKEFLQFLGKASFSIYMVHYFIAFALFNSIKFAGKIVGILSSATPDDIMRIGQSSDFLFWPALYDQNADLAFVKSAWVMDLITIAFVGIVLVVARLSYRYIERPGVNFFNERIRRLERSRA